MFAAERDGELIVFEQTHLRGKNFSDHFIERAVGGVDSRKRVDPDLLVGLEFEFFVVELHISARGEDGGGSVARPVLVRSGAFERHRKNHGARCCVLRVLVRKAAEISGGIGVYRVIFGLGSHWIHVHTQFTFNACAETDS